MLLKALDSKCATRLCFEILFEIYRFLPVRESDSCFDAPWLVFRCMGVFAGVVVFETIFNVLREPSVKSIRIN